MDKLEPLVRHRFWILFAVSLPLAVAGYFLANSEMQAATESRESTLERVLREVPPGTSEPNKDYADKLAAINKDLQQENDVEIQKLWEAQRERMTWPEIVLPYLPNEHRGEVSRPGLKRYALEYSGILKRLWEKVQPVVRNPHPPGLTVDWPEKVLLMPETMPVQDITRHSDITTDQMWNAQEDVWLLELLFDAIVRTNEHATYIGDAPVRAIEELYLTGGNGDPSAFLKGEEKEETTGGNGKGKEAEDFGSWDEFEASQNGEGGGRGSYGDDDEDGYAGFASGGYSAMNTGVSAPREIKFDIAEEIGPQVPDPKQAVEETSATSATQNALMALRSQTGVGPRLGGFGARAAQDDAGPGGRPTNAPPGSPGMFRYVGMPDDVEKEPYQERAFYMSAVVMLPDLPNFLTELASSDWPIRIGRFQIGPNPYADTAGKKSRRIQSRNSGRGLGGRSNNDGGGFLSGASFAQGLGLNGTGQSGMMLGRGPATTLPPTIAGPSEIDPNWFSDTELVRVDFYGVITMYKPITNAAITKTSDGTSAEESLEELKATEAAEQAAEDASTLDSDAAGSPDLGSTESTSPDAEPASDADNPAGEPAPSDEPESTEETVDEDPFVFGAPDEPPPDEAPSEGEAAPDQ